MFHSGFTTQYWVLALCVCFTCSFFGTGRADDYLGGRWIPPSPSPASGGMLAFHSETEHRSLRRESFFDPPNAVTNPVTFADNSRTLRELPLRVEDVSEFRMPGEFEYQSGLMISCQAICFSDAIRDVVRAVARRISIVALYGNEEEYHAAREVLAESGIPANIIGFALIPHDTMWTRDYGPVVPVSKQSRDIAVLDTQYRSEGRDHDEVVPVFVADSAALPIVDAQLKIEGGNVISNGRGLLVTTTKLLDENAEIDHQTVSDALCMYYGATQVVFLEPLANESTGHVDMFVTFTSTICRSDRRRT